MPWFVRARRIMAKSVSNIGTAKMSTGMIKPSMATFLNRPSMEMMAIM